MSVICEYEAQYGEIVINGKRYVDVLQSEIDEANKVYFELFDHI